MMSLQQLIASPAWFPDAIYTDRGLLDVYQVGRQLLSDSPFLDQRMTSRSGGRQQAAFTYAELALLAEGFRTDGICFVFHTSFCRSTLMAQALHVDGVSFSLKEPSILLSLAESIRYTRSMQESDKIRVALAAMLRLVTGLVGQNEKAIIKPTNFANNLLPYIADTGAKILLMYSSLRSYLISILKYGERGRAFTRQLYIRLMADCKELGKIEPGQALLQTDLQIAALVWQQQMSLFMEVIDTARRGQIHTLSSDVFGARREAVLAGVFRFFDIPVSGRQLEQVLTGPVFRQHSKSGKMVDDQTILHQTQAISDRYQEELESTLQWAATTMFANRIRVPLPNGLAVPDADGI